MEQAMKLGEKLSKLRKENNYTQEQLADILGVSRQAISKWESNTAYPETDKLIRMSELFNCSLDYLLKETEESDGRRQTHENAARPGRILREMKSEKTVWGMPLWHIGKNARGFIAIGLNACGVIAIGLSARGIVSLGMLSMGILSLGMLPIGLISLGQFALGIMAAGCISVGVFSAGAVSIGIISIGAVSIGNFSIGAFSVGKYFAFGDNARAMIAVGGSKATGDVYQKIGELSSGDIDALKQLLDTVVPPYLSWAKMIIEMFLQAL